MSVARENSIHPATPTNPTTKRPHLRSWLGNQAWTLNLEWSGSAGFNAAPVQNWTLDDGSVAGELRTFGGFSFLRVFDAGHMVPADKPAAALALLNEFIHAA